VQVRFWGTRGSIPTPGPGTLRHGGNTSCVEVRSAAGTLLILDCGTGLRVLGESLLAAGERPLRGHILISHTHWDHIQGVPFFAPLFAPGNEWDVYAPRGLAQTLRDTLAGQMHYTYFPVALDQLGATIRYHELVEGALTVGDVVVRTEYLNHPALTLGYRLEADGAAVVYACDHEPYARRLASGEGEIDGRDGRHADFLAGADLVIHDAQYTAAEYPAKAGWGHSTVEYAVAVARRA
jgi:phosphoribosyl 1,2-cyclic phosphodiesterase